MAITYKLIASTTLSSASQPVTFSSIPSTYTHLMLWGFSQENASSVNGSNIMLRFNSDATSSAYSNQYQIIDGTSAPSTSFTQFTYMRLYNSTCGNLTSADSYGGFTAIIPNYTSTLRKIVYAHGHGTGNTNITMKGAINSGNSTVGATSSALTRIDIYNGNLLNFAIGSTFQLYGIGTTV